MTPQRRQAFFELEADLIRGIEAAKTAGVPQGLIVALLHAHAHMQTQLMIDAA